MNNAWMGKVLYGMSFVFLGLSFVTGEFLWQPWIIGCILLLTGSIWWNKV